MTSLGTYWRTLRHLKLRQFTGRVVFKLARPKVDLAAPPPRRSASGPWVLPAARRPSLLGPQRFSFLNVQGDLASLGWMGPPAEKLWRYNQHYFDDLNAQGAASRPEWHLALIDNWIRQNPPGQGDGWEPYPLSLRIVNWLKASASGLVLPPDAWHSLAVQTRWLMQRLEWHLLGNHLFANAKALVMAGLAFEGPEAERWLKQGLEILSAELPEQVLPDGGQFERSPMYHALALEDVLDLVNAAEHGGPLPDAGCINLNTWRNTAARMLKVLQLMCHPDGRLASFNDSAHGIAPDPAELVRYARGLGIEPPASQSSGLSVLPDLGYARWERDGAVALMDVAPVGPDYLPGHAHADTLSFELSLAGRRVVVNGGTSCYGSSARRLQERGTAAHSTVQLGSHNSSEVWSGFRVGRRAYPRDLKVGADEIACSLDGYAWLSGQPVHRRAWRWGPKQLVVEDAVSGPDHPAVARFHLAPALTCVPAEARSMWNVCDAGKVVARVAVLHGDGDVVASTHSPEFGVVLPTQCLVVRLTDGRAVTRWQWGLDAHPVS